MAPVLIDPKGDVALEVVEYDEDAVDGAKERPVLRKQEFQVSRTVLIRDSRYFKTMFLPGHFTDSKKGSIALHDDTVASMELWLRALHKTELSYDQSLLEMWNIASASDKYHFELSLLIPWFKVWYKRYNIDTLYTNFKVDEKLNEKLGIVDTRALLYPCWIFDHPQGFLRATEFLVYNCAGHVTEFNPTKHTKLHLESPVIQQLNAARGRLRTILHKELFTPYVQLYGSSCQCKEATLFNYGRTLWRIDVMPLEDNFPRTSMATILHRLEDFTFEPKKGACRSCRVDYNTLVENASRKTLDYFDGMCLDCMDRTKPVTKDEDMDYWYHKNLNRDYFTGRCRVKHGQPTWYFSFMGRKIIRDRFLRKKGALFGSRDSDSD